MALLNKPRWFCFGTKPISAKGTAMAFAAGEAVFKRNGVNPILKEAVKQSIRNDKKPETV